MCSETNLAPKVTLDEISESGAALYQRLVNLVGQEGRKLVLCVEKNTGIKGAVQALVKQGMSRDRIVEYDPEDTSEASRDQWQIVD